MQLRLQSSTRLVPVTFSRGFSVNTSRASRSGASQQGHPHRNPEFRAGPAALGQRQQAPPAYPRSSCNRNLSDGRRYRQKLANPRHPRELMPKLSLAKLERHLYGAADRLRQEGLDAATYKDYIFGLLFLKRCSDVFEGERERIETALRNFVVVPYDHEIARCYACLAAERQTQRKADLVARRLDRRLRSAPRRGPGDTQRQGFRGDFNTDGDFRTDPWPDMSRFMPKWWIASSESVRCSREP